MAEEFLSRAELSEAILKQLKRRGVWKTETELKTNINNAGGKQIKDNADLQVCLRELVESDKLLRDGAALTKR